MKKRNIILLAVLVVILGLAFVSNFNEAQIRSKVARSKGDMLTISQALESYYVDHHCYPGQVPLKNFSFQPNYDYERDSKPPVPEFSVLEKAYGDHLRSIDPGLSHPGVAGLTTPVAYLPKLLTDPFINFRGEKGIPYAYHVYRSDTDYLIWSPGPDKTYDITDPAELYDPEKSEFTLKLFLKAWYPNYFDTNNGDIWRINKKHESWEHQWTD